MTRAELSIGVLVLAAGIVAPAARGQAVLDVDQLTNYGNAFWYDQKGGQHGTFDGNFTTNGQDFDDARKVSWDEDGFSAFVFSHNTTAYGPSNPGLGGAFGSVTVSLDSTSEITASDLKAHTKEEAYGQPYDYIYFTLPQTTDWAWKADVSGSSSKGFDNYGRCSFSIYDVNNNAYVFSDQRQASNGDSFNDSVFESGKLAAGKYLLYFDALTNVHNENGQGGVGSAAAAMNGVFTFTVPAPGAAGLLGLGGLAAARRRRA